MDLMQLSWAEYMNSHEELSTAIHAQLRHIRIEAKLYNTLQALTQSWIWVVHIDSNPDVSLLTLIYGLSECTDKIELKIIVNQETCLLCLAMDTKQLIGQWNYKTNTIDLQDSLTTAIKSWKELSAQ